MLPRAGSMAAALQSTRINFFAHRYCALPPAYCLLPTESGSAIVNVVP